jgi:hypothetical protein
MSGTQLAVDDGDHKVDDKAIEVDDGAQNEIEVRARAMGWKPQNEYRGPAGHWRDAAEFVRRGEDELPIVRERYRAAERKIDELKGQLDRTTAVISELTERTRTRDERAYQRAKRDLLSERDAAVEVGDTKAFRRIEAELEDLQKEAPTVVRSGTQAAAAGAVSQPQEPHPDAVRWAHANPLYQTDAAMAQEAHAEHIRLLNLEPSLSVTENLTRVTNILKARYPGRIEASMGQRGPAPAERQQVDGSDSNPKRAEPAAVTSSAAPRGPQRVSARSFEAMPSDSKDAFYRYQKSMSGKGQPLKKEEWAADYWQQFE